MSTHEEGDQPPSSPPSSPPLSFRPPLPCPICLLLAIALCLAHSCITFRPPLKREISPSLHRQLPCPSSTTPNPITTTVAFAVVPAWIGVGEGGSTTIEQMTTSQSPAENRVAHTCRRGLITPISPLSLLFFSFFFLLLLFYMFPPCLACHSSLLSDTTTAVISSTTFGLDICHLLYDSATMRRAAISVFRLERSNTFATSNASKWSHTPSLASTTKLCCSDLSQIATDGMEVTPTECATSSPIDRDMARPGESSLASHTRCGPMSSPNPIERRWTRPPDLRTRMASCSTFAVCSSVI
mmetsp:Transcript_1031/g.2153  ORF Transcript_1031/g.2153 Transcript_1031/m.2153 type:complete len:298 (+) Transcript_1031:698-1591(+)